MSDDGEKRRLGLKELSSLMGCVIGTALALVFIRRGIAKNFVIYIGIGCSAILTFAACAFVLVHRWRRGITPSVLRVFNICVLVSLLIFLASVVCFVLLEAN